MYAISNNYKNLIENSLSLSPKSKIVVDNIELATKDLIFVGVKTNKSHLEINQPTYSEEYAEITKKLDIIKVMTQNCVEPKVVKDIIIEITDILDYLIGRLD